MNEKQQLELQAYLDGELSARAARRAAGWLAQNPEAQALAAELRMTQGALAGNEPEATVAESREFYWSKIERAIAAAERPEPESRSVPGWRLIWRRLLLPLSGVALATILAVGLIRSGADDPSRHLTEVENLSEFTVSHSFGSDKMFVVWIENRAQTQGDNPQSFDDDDIVIQ
jgi:anti-sigma factor RsiW